MNDFKYFKYFKRNRTATKTAVQTVLNHRLNHSYHSCQSNSSYYNLTLPSSIPSINLSAVFSAVLLITLLAFILSALTASIFVLGILALSQPVLAAGPEGCCMKSDFCGNATLDDCCGQPGSPFYDDCKNNKWRLNSCGPILCIKGACEDTCADNIYIYDCPNAGTSFRPNVQRNSLPRCVDICCVSELFTVRQCNVAPKGPCEANVIGAGEYRTSYSDILTCNERCNNPLSLGTVIVKVLNSAGNVITTANVYVGATTALYNPAQQYYVATTVGIGQQDLLVRAPGFNEIAQSITVAQDNRQGPGTPGNSNPNYFEVQLVAITGKSIFSGFVKDNANNPVKGAFVTIGAETTVTDNRGYYQLSIALGAGNGAGSSAVATASKPNYISDSISITLSDGAQQLNFILAPVQQGTIDITVKKSNAQPIQGAAINLIGTDSPVQYDFVTDANGRVQSSVANVQYRVTASATGYISQTLNIIVVAGTTTSRTIILASSSSVPCDRDGICEASESCSGSDAKTECSSQFPFNIDLRCMDAQCADSSCILAQSVFNNLKEVATKCDLASQAPAAQDDCSGGRCFCREGQTMQRDGQTIIFHDCTPADCDPRTGIKPNGRCDLAANTICEFNTSVKNYREKLYDINNLAQLTDYCKKCPTDDQCLCQGINEPCDYTNQSDFVNSIFYIGTLCDASTGSEVKTRYPNAQPFKSTYCSKCPGDPDCTPQSSQCTAAGGECCPAGLGQGNPLSGISCLNGNICFSGGCFQQLSCPISSQCSSTEECTIAAGTVLSGPTAPIIPAGKVCCNLACRRTPRCADNVAIASPLNLNTGFSKCQCGGSNYDSTFFETIAGSIKNCCNVNGQISATQNSCPPLTTGNLDTFLYDKRTTTNLVSGALPSSVTLVLTNVDFPGVKYIKVSDAPGTPTAGRVVINSIVPGKYAVSTSTNADFVIAGNRTRPPGVVLNNYDSVPATPIIEIKAAPPNMVLDFLLVPSPGCFRNPAPKSGLTAQHVKNNPAIVLSWGKPCDNIVSYQLTSSRGLSRTVPAAASSDTQSYSVTDNNLPPSAFIRYTLTTFYNTPAISPITETVDVTLGTAQCFQARDKEFCAVNPLNPSNAGSTNPPTSSAVPTLRMTCNSTNMPQLVNAPDADCQNVFGENSICTGPFASGTTRCSQAANCNTLGNPFGLFHSSAVCEGINDENYCYYDYSYSSVNTCKNCSSVRMCAGYSSEGACKKDSCGVSGKFGNTQCTWIPNKFSEFGKGFCTDSKYPNNDYCKLCNSTSAIFSNAECSQRICSGLGLCYSKDLPVQNSPGTFDLNCLECKTSVSDPLAQRTTCASFNTEEACNGVSGVSQGTNFNINQLPGIDSLAAPLNNEGNFTYSKGACNLNRCRWNSNQNKCYKDANSNGADDCAGLTASSVSALLACQADQNPPVTKITQLLPVYNLQGGDIVFEADDVSTTNQNILSDINTSYCINQLSTLCYPNNKIVPDSNGRLKVKIYDATANVLHPSAVQGINKIVFYSVDKYSNVEPLQDAVFLVDTVPPIIQVRNYTVSPASNSALSTAEIIINSSEPSRCTISIAEPAQIFGYNVIKGIQNEIGSNFTMIVTDMPDAFYTLIFDCSDANGNSISEARLRTTTIHIDRFHAISDEEPLGIFSNLSVMLKIKTNDPGNCFYTLVNPVIGQTTAFDRRVDPPQGLLGNYAYEALFPKSGTPGIFSSGLTSGNYAFVINCNNDPSQTAMDTSSIRFTIDRTAPITTPFFVLDDQSRIPANFTKPVKTPKIELKCNDPDIGISPGLGCDATKFCFASTLSECKSNYLDYIGNIISLTDTTRHFCYFSNDSGKNTENEVCSSITIDNTAPELIITGLFYVKAGNSGSIIPLQKGNISGTDELLVRGTFSDTSSPVKISFYSSLITDNSFNSTTVVVSSASNGQFEARLRLYDRPFGEAENLVVVSAKDSAGNINTSNVIVKYDRIGPELSNIKAISEGNDISGLGFAQHGQNINFSLTAEDTKFLHEFVPDDVSKIEIIIVCNTTSSIACYFDGGNTQKKNGSMTKNINQGNQWNYTLVSAPLSNIPGFFNLHPANYTVTFVAYDIFDNPSVTKTQFEIKDTKAPRINITIATPFNEGVLPKVIRGRSYNVTFNFSEPSYIIPFSPAFSLISDSNTGSDKDFLALINPAAEPTLGVKLLLTQTALTADKYNGIEGNNSEFYIEVRDVWGNLASRFDIISGRYFSIDTKGPGFALLRPDVPDPKIIYTKNASYSIIGFTFNHTNSLLNSTNVSINVSYYSSNLNPSNPNAPSLDYGFVLTSAKLSERLNRNRAAQITVMPQNPFTFNFPAGSAIIQIQPLDINQHGLATGNYIQIGNSLFNETFSDRPGKGIKSDFRRYRITSVQQTPFGFSVGITPPLESVAFESDNVSIFAEEVPTAYFNLELPLLTEGEYSFRLFAYDEIGNAHPPAGQANVYKIRRDITQPKGFVIYPASGAMSTSFDNFSARFADTFELDQNSINVFFESDNALNQMSFNCSSQFLQCVFSSSSSSQNSLNVNNVTVKFDTRNLPIGIYNVTFSAKDLAGNANTTYAQFIIFAIPNAPTVLYPEEIFITNQSSVLISGFDPDANSGFSVSIKISNTSVTPRTTPKWHTIIYGKTSSNPLLFNSFRAENSWQKGSSVVQYKPFNPNILNKFIEFSGHSRTTREFYNITSNVEITPGFGQLILDLALVGSVANNEQFNVFSRNVPKGWFGSVLNLNQTVSEGRYFYYAVSANQFGHNSTEYSAERTIVFDKTPPVAGMISPANGTKTNETITSIVILASDNYSGIDQNQISVTIVKYNETNVNTFSYNGNQISFSEQSSFQGSSYVISVAGVSPFEDGALQFAKYNVTFKLVDKAGNIRIAQSNFERSDRFQPPPLILVVPSRFIGNEFYSNSPSPFILVRSRIGNGLLNITNISLVSRTNGTRLTGLDATFGNYTFNNTLFNLIQFNRNLSEGEYDFEVEGFSELGSNFTTSSARATAMIDIDFIPPGVLFQSYPLPPVNKLSNVQINGSYSEIDMLDGFSSQSPENIHLVTISGAGVRESINASFVSAGQFIATVNLADNRTNTAPGNRTVIATACDKAGNCNSTNTTVLYERNIPEISINGACSREANDQGSTGLITNPIVQCQGQLLQWYKSDKISIWVKVSDMSFVNQSGISVVKFCSGFRCIFDSVDTSSSVIGMVDLSLSSVLSTSNSLEVYAEVNVSGSQTTNMTFFAIDNAGNEAKNLTMTLRIDSIAPTTGTLVRIGNSTQILSANEVNGTWLNENVSVNFVSLDPAAPDGSGSNISSLEINYCNLVNSACNKSVLRQSPYNLTISFAESGIYKINYSSIDFAGNTEPVKELYLFLDKELPNVTISSIENAFGSYDTVTHEYRTSILNGIIVNGTVTDAFSGRKSVQVLLFDGSGSSGGSESSGIRSTEPMYSAIFAGTINNARFSSDAITVSVPFGTSIALLNLSVNITDFAGNNKVSYATLKFDLQGPNITIISPSNIFSEGPFNVLYSNVQNPELVIRTSEPTNCSIDQFRSGLFLRMFTSDYVIHRFNYQTIPEGSYDVSVVCSDSLRNSATKDFKLVIDVTKPDINLTLSFGELDDGFANVWNVSRLNPNLNNLLATTIIAKDAKPSKTDIINCSYTSCIEMGIGQCTNPNNNPHPYGIEDYLPLQEERVTYFQDDPAREFQYVISCRDKAGNFDAEQITVKLVVPVVFAIIPVFPKQNELIGTSTINLIVETTHFAECQIDPFRLFDVTNSNVHSTVLSVLEGDRNLSITCRSELGPVARKTINFKVDLTPPTIDSIISQRQSERRTSRNTNADFEWTASDRYAGIQIANNIANYSYTFYYTLFGSLFGIAQTVGSNMTNVFFDNQIILFDGNYSFSVFAIDKARNIGTPKNFTFGVDTTSPLEIVLGDLPDSVNLTSASVKVSGRVFKDSDVPESAASVKLFVNNIISALVTTNATGHFSIPITLSSPVNRLIVSATDEFGNGPVNASKTVIMITDAPIFTDNICPRKNSRVCSAQDVNAILTARHGTSISQYSTISLFNSTGVVQNLQIAGQQSLAENQEGANITFRAHASLADENYTVRIFALDNLGNRAVYNSTFAVNKFAPCIDSCGIIINSSVPLLDQPRLSVSSARTKDQNITLVVSANLTDGSPAILAYVIIEYKSEDGTYAEIFSGRADQYGVLTFTFRPLEQGIYYFRAKATDFFANSPLTLSNTVSTVFVTNGPIITYSFLEGQKFSSNPTLKASALSVLDTQVSTITISAKRATDGLPLELNINDSQQCALFSLCKDFQFRQNLPLSGTIETYAATVNSTDVLGLSNSASRTFVVDKNAPEIHFIDSDLETNSINITHDQTKNIIGYITSTTSNNLVSGTVNVTFERQVSIIRSLTVFEETKFNIFDLPIDEGRNTLIFKVTDSVGNVNVRQVEVIRRRTLSGGYSLQILSPNGTLLNPTTTFVDKTVVVGDYSFRDSEIIYINLSLNGNIVKTIPQSDILNGFSFQLSGLSKNNTNKISASLLDVWGNVTYSNAVFVNYGVLSQNLPFRPYLDVISSPNADSPVVISGVVKDKVSGVLIAGANVRVLFGDGSSADVVSGSDGRFRLNHFYPFSPARDYVVAAVAFAGDGFPSESDSRVFFYSLVPPNIEVYPSVFGIYRTLGRFVVLCKPSGDGVSVSFCNVSSFVGTGFNQPSYSVSPGLCSDVPNGTLCTSSDKVAVVSVPSQIVTDNYLFTAVSRDSLANQRSDVFVYKINTNAPDIIISDPSAAEVMLPNSVSSITISGTVIDSDGVDRIVLIVIGEDGLSREFSVLRSPQSGTNINFQGAVPVSEGMSLIFVNASDNLTNVGSRVIKVVREPGAPVMISFNPPHDVPYSAFFSQVAVSGNVRWGSLGDNRRYLPYIARVNLYLNSHSDFDSSPDDGSFEFVNVPLTLGLNNVSVNVTTKWGRTYSLTTLVNYSGIMDNRTLIPYIAVLDNMTSPTNKPVIIKGKTVNSSSQIVGGVNVNIYVNNAKQATLTSDQSGRFLLVFTPPEEGIYNIYARALYGNLESDFESQNVFYIISLPLIYTIPVEGGIIGLISSINMSFVQKDKANISISNLVLVKDIVNLVTPLSVTELTCELPGCRILSISTPLLTDGRYKLTYNINDTLQKASDALSFTVNTKAPQIKLTNPDINPLLPFLTQASVLQLRGDIILEDGMQQTSSNIISTEVKLNGIVIGSLSVFDSGGIRFVKDVALSEGENNISLKVVDSFQRVGQKNIIVLKRKTIKESKIKIIYPLSGDTLFFPSVSVEGLTDDPILQKIRLFVNDALQQEVQTSLTSFLFQARLSNGSNLLRVEEIDLFNDSSFDTVRVFFDSRGPIVRISGNYPLFTRVSPITVSGSIQSNISVNATLIQTSLLGTRSKSLPTNNNSFSDIVSLDPGLNILRIDASNPAGTGSSGEQQIVFDRTSPVITVLSHQNNSLTNSPNTLFEASASDSYFDFISGKDISSVDRILVWLNGNLLIDFYAGNNIPFVSVPFTLVQGENKVIVESIDKAGNINSSTINIRLDTLAPLIAITSVLADNSIVFSTKNISTTSFNVNIKGQVTDANLKSVHLKSDKTKTAILSGSAFEINISLNQGINKLDIVAEDLVGNTAEDTAIVNVDNVPPEIISFAPETRTSSIVLPIINITTDEPASCSLSYESSRVIVRQNFTTRSSNGVLALHGTLHSIRLLQPLDNDISLPLTKTDLNILCKDELQNSKLSIVEFFVDIKPPVINNFESVFGSIINDSISFKKYLITLASATKLKVDANEPVRCKFSNSTTIFSQMENKFEGFDLAPQIRYSHIAFTDFIPLSNKVNYTFYISCEDKAGLTTSEYKAIELKVDRLDNVFIYDLYPPRYINKKILNISVKTASDADCSADIPPDSFIAFVFDFIRRIFVLGGAAMEKTVTGAVFRHETNISSIFSELQELQEGSTYKARVTCSDRSGQGLATSTVQINFTVDTLPPILNITLPPGVTNTSIINITGITEINTTITILINGLPVTTIFNQDPGFVIPISLVPGQNNLTVIVSDLAGNTAQQNFTTFFANRGPVVISVRPSRGTFRNIDNITVVFGDNGGGINISRTIVSFAGPQGNLAGNIQSNGTNSIVFIPGQLTAGSYRFTATPFDLAGNEGQSAISLFEINPSAPDIRISGIYHNMITNNALLSISGSIYSDQEISSIDLIVNGRRIPVPFAMSQSPVTLFFVQIPLTEGTNFVQISVETNLGNAALTDVYIITLKTTGPKIISLTINQK